MVMWTSRILWDLAGAWGLDGFIFIRAIEVRECLKAGVGMSGDFGATIVVEIAHGGAE